MLIIITVNEAYRKSSDIRLLTLLLFGGWCYKVLKICTNIEHRKKRFCPTNSLIQFRHCRFVTFRVCSQHNYDAGERSVHRACVRATSLSQRSVPTHNGLNASDEMGRDR